MNKKVVILIVMLVVLLGALAFVVLKFFEKPKPLAANVPEVRITYKNFEEEVSKQSLVQDLPDEGAIFLRFYNFKNNEKVWENSYVLRSTGVQKSELTDADLIIHLHARYLESLTNHNFCSIIEQAKAAGDLGVETRLSKTSLAWKYHSMLKYRECLGF